VMTVAKAEVTTPIEIENSQKKTGCCWINCNAEKIHYLMI
jgi:hypothetical protein